MVQKQIVNMEFRIYFTIVVYLILQINEPFGSDWKGSFLSLFACFLLYLFLGVIWRLLKIDEYLDHLFCRILSVINFIFCIETSFYYAYGRVHFWDANKNLGQDPEYDMAFGSLMISFVFLIYALQKFEESKR